MTRVTLVTAVLMGLVAVPARADVTLFLGANTTPANRTVRGGAFGVGLLIVGFEGEYANTPDDPSANAPSLMTGSATCCCETPFAIVGLQPYFTTAPGSTCRPSAHTRTPAPPSTPAAA
jgi:hypothetical protein